MSIPFIDLKKQYHHLKETIDSHIQVVLDHGQYIMGPEITQLEQALANYVGVKHAISVSDGTTALLVALMALGIRKGDEVITSPFTFIATGEMIALLGAKPVFVDIEAQSYNLDPDQIEAAITPKTKAILPVSLYGQCADFSRINQIAQKHALPVIEDGAQSFGSQQAGKRSGGLSMIGCTSFFPSKPLGCYGDGGACFTDDNGLAKRMREIRSHGQDQRYHHPIIGLNGRMDTLQAAVLLAKLPTFEQEVNARQRLGQRYTEKLKDNVITPIVMAGNKHVYAQYTIQVEHRAQVQEALKKQGIPTAVHYPIPLHLQPAFSYLPWREGAFPISEAVAKQVLSLPMHPFLTDTEQDYIVQQVKRVL